MKTSEKKQKISPGRCQKCNNLGYGVNLIGGYNGSFCDEHLNEWHEIVIDRPEYKDLVVKNASMDALIRGGVASQSSRDLHRAILEQYGAFYGLAKAWAEESDLVTEVQDGLYRKYVVTKASGEPIDPKAFYFPLRLDKDPHARTAARMYADSIMIDNPTLSDELHNLVDGIETDLIKKSIREKND